MTSPQEKRGSVTQDGYESLTRLDSGRYVTRDGKYRITQIPRDSGRPDAGAWFLGWADPDRGLIGQPWRTMYMAREELVHQREDDAWMARHSGAAA